nr:hypothetical protein [Pseudomonadota bacterium]
MDTPQPSQSPFAGRTAGLVLGLVLCACVALIAATGYVKLQLDHADAVMAAPGAAFLDDQEAFDKLSRALGYSGFVGFAQNFAASHEASLLSDMRAQSKTAADVVSHLPGKTPGESRHDLQAIVAVFDSALQKAEKDPNNFTAADMAPLYAALPVLDSRLESAAAANRLEAQQHLHFWSMLLTLASLCSLLVAAFVAAGTYLALRGRNSMPLKALAQSVKNMARGDMRTSIWGMERPDMVGDLARAIDLARYHFS